MRRPIDEDIDQAEWKSIRVEQPLVFPPSSYRASSRSESLDDPARAAYDDAMNNVRRAFLEYTEYESSLHAMM